MNKGTDVKIDSENVMKIEDNTRILDLVQKIVKSKVPITLWQLDELTNEKNVFRCVAKEINYTLRRLLITPLPGQKLPKTFNTPVFFLSHHRKTLLKSRIRSRGSDYLEIEIPKLASIQNTRREKRINIKDQKIIVTLNIENVETPVKAALVDYSKHGVGLIVSKPIFNLVEKLTLMKIVSPHFPETHDVEIIVRNKETCFEHPSIPDSNLLYRIGGEHYSD